MALPPAVRLVPFLCIAPFEVGYRMAIVLWRRAFPRRGSLERPNWTLRQALAVGSLKGLLKWISTLRLSPPGLLAPGPEGKRFALLRPADERLYAAPLDDKEVRPQVIGATWTPSALTSKADVGDDARVLLHFHGGAYVIGSGRDQDTGYMARLFLAHTGVTHVVMPQYRLCDRPDRRFPAAVQDALTAYMHLIDDLGVPPQRIILSGDSAGAHLALSLLRHISNHGAALGIPWPAAVLLFSPWSNLSAFPTAALCQADARYDSDYIHEAFPFWGRDSLSGYGRFKREDPWISPGLGGAFKIVPRVFVQTGSVEILYNDNARLVDIFRAEGTDIEWMVSKDCPHDILLVGDKLGFDKEAAEASKRAGEFVAKVLQ
jgi:acetyl esterase/lipase